MSKFIKIRLFSVSPLLLLLLPLLLDVFHLMLNYELVDKNLSFYLLLVKIIQQRKLRKILLRERG